MIGTAAFFSLIIVTATSESDWSGKAEDSIVYLGSTHVGKGGASSHSGRTSPGTTTVPTPSSPCFSTELGEFALGACMYNLLCPDLSQVSPAAVADARARYSIGPRNAEFCRDEPSDPQRSVTLQDVVEEEWRQIQLPTPVIEIQP